jgi:myo-inositol 2-dehydrogenase / D-chiro-inositol 1-dehydrogenase
MDSSHRPSRRGFLASGTTAAVGLMVHSSTPAAEDTQVLRLGIVGCGGRGTGAVDDSLTANKYVRLVAAADPFPAKADALRQTLAEKHADKVVLDDAHIFGGIDGYQRILADPEIDIVMLTSPPGFRPRMILEAVQAGKHVFAEKPVCVDPAGYRICQAAQAAAEAAGTAIVTGTQYRRQANYIGAVEQIRQGAIGDIVGGTTRYCSTGIWYRPRKEGMSDTEYQINNWMHFIWLSGDQIAEQAVHNIDTINWAMGGNPVSAYGSGGRFTRPDDSEMWDSMSIDYEYPGGRTISFMCRQIPGTTGDNGSVIHGTEGTCFIGAINSGSRIVNRKGDEIWSADGSISDAYRQEHADLVASIRAGKPIVELAQTADSSLTAVLGRVAAYTGQRVTFDFLANESQLDLFPEKLDWAGSLPQPKHAIPGRTKLL